MPWCPLSFTSSKFKVKDNRPKVKILSSSCQFFASNWINSPNTTILAPINFCLMPFYLSHVSDSDGIWKNPVTQNGCCVQVLHDMILLQWDIPGSSLIHIKWVLVYIRTYFTPKERLFTNLFSCIIKVYRIKHMSSHHAFFTTCSINLYCKKILRFCAYYGNTSFLAFVSLKG